MPAMTRAQIRTREAAIFAMPNRPFCDTHHSARKPWSGIVVGALETPSNSATDPMITALPEMKASATRARTVVAWFPQPSELRRGTDGAVTIQSPAGWAVCDGTRGTSDLSDRFIIDGLRKGEISASGVTVTQGNDKINPPANIPLIYIMKLQL